MTHNDIKNLIKPFNDALYDLDTTVAKSYLAKIAPNAIFHQCYPFGDFDRADDFFDNVYKPLISAIADLEKRAYINIAGYDQDGNHWLGMGGFFTGVFTNDFLGIKATSRIVYMRFHEFYKVYDNQVVEYQAIWDIPQLINQANCWPLAPSLGVEINPPAPATCDGLIVDGDEQQAKKSANLVYSMLESLKKHPKEPPEAMELSKYWHPKMNWYGPSGIGSNRGISGFRFFHQIPFLKAFPDRGEVGGNGLHHLFAEGNYVAITGWPNMIQTHTGNSFLGLPPTNKKIHMKSLDFWRIELDKIRENWVLIDLLDFYNQIGIDVLGRMQEFNDSKINFIKNFK